MASEAEIYAAERYQLAVEIRVPRGLSAGVVQQRLEREVHRLPAEAYFDPSTRTMRAAWHYTTPEEAVVLAATLRCAADTDPQLLAAAVRVFDMEADRCLWVNGDTLHGPLDQRARQGGLRDP